MKKLIVFTLLLMCASAWAEIGVTDITSGTTQPNRRLVSLLRKKVGEINTAITNASSDKGTSDVWYVDSVTGSSTNDGKSADYPMATLNQAIDKAGEGDYIYILESSTQAMGAAADEVDVDVDGLWIEQLGVNTQSNGFDYTGDVTGAFAIGADNVTLVNMRFHANVTDVNEAIEVEAGSVGFRVISCLFDCEAEGTDDFLECIDGSAGAASDRMEVIGCQFLMGAGACNAAINTKDTDYARYLYNDFRGDYAVACIKSNTTASNHILIAENVLVNATIGGAAGLNAQPVIELVATDSGTIINNVIACNVATPDAAIVAADCWVFGNTYTETEGGVSVPPMWLTTDTVLNPIGFNDADNGYDSSAVAANADGSILERLEQVDVDTSAILVDTAAIQPYQERTIAVADVNIADGSVDDVLTISGGPVLVTSLAFVLTEAASNNSVTMAFEADPTTGAGDLNIASAVDIDNTAIGGWIYAEGDGSAAVISAIGGNVAQGCTVPFVLPIGGLDITMQSADLTTGIGTLYMTYKPILAASTVAE